MDYDIAVVGAGIIGLEFASIYNALGSKVALIEMMPELLTMMDRDIVSIMQRNLESKKIELFLNSMVKKIDPGLKVVFCKDETKTIIECDQVAGCSRKGGQY